MTTPTCTKRCWPHLNSTSAHVLAHDLGDSVGQELFARPSSASRPYGALRIESITWLNGGLFIEAYTPGPRRS